MSATVRITGWRPGQKKVSMTEAIRRSSTLGLSAAKSCTDRVLDGHAVEVCTLDEQAGSELVSTLQALGAVAELVSGPPNPALQPPPQSRRG